MRILFNLHLFFPDHRCGSENYALHVLTYLKSQGHEVRVILNQAKMHNVSVPYTYEGIEVFGEQKNMDSYRWADVILTHLDFTRWSIQIAATIGKPVVFFAHNDIPYGSVANAKYIGCNISVVYNSNWMIKNLEYDCPSMVLTPPCDYRYYNVCENPEENEYITLISLNENKGGNLFYHIARSMPDHKFLGVMGSYDEQIIKELPNVTIVPKGDILPIYRKTKILLMPSRYESWGMTATEAMCSGIPVVCTPTYGLKENCDYAGIYVKGRNPIPVDFADNGNIQDLEDLDLPHVDKWVEAIKSVENNYQKYSNLARQRSIELDPQKGLTELNKFLIAAYAGT